jgi:hypothetical protein
MRRKLFVSLLVAATASVVVIGTVFAASLWTAGQKGFHQEGSGQAAQLRIRVEAGIADPTSTLVPETDPGACITITVPCGPGGALAFTIDNTGNMPLRVTGLTALCISGCTLSNKNTDGTFPVTGTGSCGTYGIFVAPSTFKGWPIIPAHATLQVNGTDNNALGAGMLHLRADTPQGCQGATYQVQLTVTAQDASS